VILALRHRRRLLVQGRRRHLQRGPSLLDDHLRPRPLAQAMAGHFHAATTVNCPWIDELVLDPSLSLLNFGQQ
jgi:hypothetical protein